MANDGVRHKYVRRDSRIVGTGAHMSGKANAIPPISGPPQWIRRNVSVVGAALLLLIMLFAAMPSGAQAKMFHAYIRQSSVVSDNVTAALAAVSVESTAPASVADSPSLFLLEGDSIEHVEQLIAQVYQQQDPVGAASFNEDLVGSDTTDPGPTAEGDGQTTVTNFGDSGSLKRRAVLTDHLQVFVSEVIPARKSALISVPAASWGLDRIDQHSLPLNGLYSWASGNDGANVHAWVVDTGIDTAHIEFSNGNRATLDYAAYLPAQDCDGHGTHVAGTIGGNTVGVARLIRLHSIKVLNCAGSGTTYTVAQGLMYVLAHLTGADVINLSLGYGARDSAIEAILNDLMARRASVFAAAGNEAVSACNHFPSSQAGVVSVAASTSADARSSFSNWGTCVNLFAPGSFIVSAKMGGGYTTMSGTSMATPHAVGVGALIMQMSPNISSAALWSAMLARASLGKISSGLMGSPDVLLYSLNDGPALPSLSQTATGTGTPSRAPAGASASPTPTRAPASASSTATRAPIIQPSASSTRPPAQVTRSRTSTHTRKPSASSKPSRSPTKTPSQSKRARRARSDEESSGVAEGGSVTAWTRWMVGVVAVCALMAELPF